MNFKQKQNEIKLLALMGGGSRTSPELQQALGVSQPVVSRLLSSLAGRVVRLGHARATRYAIPRNVRGVGSDFPVYAVLESGDVRPKGELLALQGGEYWWQPNAQAGELFDHLPWFVQNLRPEGFMGRAFAHTRSIELGLPKRLSDWNDDHLLVALSQDGADCSGDLILGRNSLGKYLAGTRHPITAIKVIDREKIYPQLVQSALRGDPSGSSVGGEQPKFAALVEKRGDKRHVLVKFSPPTTTTSGRRWADLLVCEHLALQLIEARGIKSAQSELLEIGDRVMLEVTRFDRCEEFGRLPLTSLYVIDTEFFGELDNWIAAAARLEDGRMLAGSDAENLRWLSVFGSLIANTDQHFGNVSLVMKDDEKCFELAPAYDVLPMLYQPQEHEVPVREFNPGAPRFRSMTQWDDARKWAQRFWTAACEDQRISSEFRQLCAHNLEIIRTLQDGPRLLV